MLAKAPSEITVGDIIQAAQGPIIPVRCLGEDSCKHGSCDVCEGCITRHVWKQTQQILLDYYNSVTIADLCALARKEGLSRELDHKYMYFI